MLENIFENWQGMKPHTHAELKSVVSLPFSTEKQIAKKFGGRLTPREVFRNPLYGTIGDRYIQIPVNIKPIIKAEIKKEDIAKLTPKQYIDLKYSKHYPAREKAKAFKLQDNVKAIEFPSKEEMLEYVKNNDRKINNPWKIPQVYGIKTNYNDEKIKLSSIFSEGEHDLEILGEKEISIIDKNILNKNKILKQAARQRLIFNTIEKLPGTAKSLARVLPKTTMIGAAIDIATTPTEAQAPTINRRDIITQKAEQHPSLSQYLSPQYILNAMKAAQPQVPLGLTLSDIMGGTVRKSPQRIAYERLPVSALLGEPPRG
jgi:hypothetical protein